MIVLKDGKVKRGVSEEYHLRYLLKVEREDNEWFADTK